MISTTVILFMISCTPDLTICREVRQVSSNYPNMQSCEVDLTEKVRKLSNEKRKLFGKCKIAPVADEASVVRPQWQLTYSGQLETGLEKVAYQKSIDEAEMKKIKSAESKQKYNVLPSNVTSLATKISNAGNAENEASAVNFSAESLNLSTTQTRMAQVNVVYLSNGKLKEKSYLVPSSNAY